MMMMTMMTNMKTTTTPPIRVIALYHFFAVADPQSCADQLYEFCRAHGIKGSLLLAHEGVNGTVAGVPDAMEAFCARLRSWLGGDFEIKASYADTMPFRRLKVKVKPEIVTMGQADIDPAVHRGTYVDARDWNALINDPDVILVDTRNDYEVALGSFDGAHNPHTASFREFPAWLAEQKAIWEKSWQESGRTPKLAMFCTGGIRCEKSTALAKRIGLNDVYHLKGGILRYLEEIPAEQSLWRGDCFVFDERVAVGQGLALTDYVLCYACRMPLTPADCRHADYVEGICCPHCVGEMTDAKRRRHAERQKQMRLAKARGTEHLGASQNKKQRVS